MLERSMKLTYYGGEYAVLPMILTILQIILLTLTFIQWEMSKNDALVLSMKLIAINGRNRR